MSSPTAHTLARLRRLGYTAGVVERFIAGAGERGQGIRRDYLGCIDVVAVKPGSPVLGIQATTLAHVSGRLAKARGIAELQAWLAAGCVFEVWGWAKRGDRWMVKVVALTGADLEPVVVQALTRKRPRSRWQPAPLFGNL